MTDTPTPQTELDAKNQADSTDDEALKKRLLNRIAVAVVIVAGLLGSLAIFDFINAPSPNPDRIATPAPEAAPAFVAKVEEPVVEAPVTAGPELAASPLTVPEATASPDAPAPLQASPKERRLTKPATGRLAMLHPADPVGRNTTEPDLPSDSGAGRRSPERHPASRPLKRAAESLFGLQLGVFSNMENAEDLRAKLEQNGIPATIEARVRAGPFASRAEADAARGKLKKLGIDESLLITLKPR